MPRGQETTVEVNIGSEWTGKGQEAGIPKDEGTMDLGV